MRKVLFVFTITLALAAVGFGQKDMSKSGITPTDSNVRSQPSSTASNDDNEAAINTGTMLQGELQTSVDVNKSKIGDRVVVKTTKDVKLGGKTVVAKGTQLVGRVTDIARRTKDIAQSRIGVLFDRIEGTDLSRPLSLTIVSITKARANAGIGDDGEAFSGEGINTTNTMSGDPARPTARGGIIRPVAGAVTGTVATVANTSSAAADSAGDVANTATRSVGSTVRHTSNVARNIDLNADASASTATTLLSNDKNFKIAKGTTITLRVDK